jgi:hypothetical protein
MMISRENRRNSEENLLQCHSAHHESHMKSPETTPEDPWRKPMSDRLSYVTVKVKLSLCVTN